MKLVGGEWIGRLVDLIDISIHPVHMSIDRYIVKVCFVFQRKHSDSSSSSSDAPEVATPSDSKKKKKKKHKKVEEEVSYLSIIIHLLRYGNLSKGVLLRHLAYCKFCIFMFDSTPSCNISNITNSDLWNEFGSPEIFIVCELHCDKTETCNALSWC